MDVTSIGELLVDFTPNGKKNEYTANPGGAPANVLSQLSRLGLETAFMGMVGNDSFGHMLRKELVASGINVTGLKVHPQEHTTLAFVHIDDSGDRTFDFYRSPGADTLLTSQDITGPLVEACKIFHFGGVSLTREPARQATMAAVEAARKAGRLVSYDPNYRAPLWEDEAQAVQLLAEGVRFCDILKVSDEEARLLTGRKDLLVAGEQLMAWGPALVLVTMGKNGCLCFHKNNVRHFETYDTPVVDTTGSGDAFLGAVLYKLLSFGVPLPALSRDQFEELCDFGNAAGAVCATKYGALASMPGKEEIAHCQSTVPKLASSEKVM